MFDQASARADRRHRTFFQKRGELCQVWARRDDGHLFYLADDAVDDDIRAAAHAGRLTCPYPGCPDPRFVAKGGPERRHHFAHKIAGTAHSAATGWRHQALLMLADWTARRYPQIQTKIDDQDGILRLHSPQTHHEVVLAVTYDPRRRTTGEAQLLLGHSSRLLLPRDRIEGEPEHWWCGKSRLVTDLLHNAGWALAVNPQERLIATLVNSHIANAAGLARGRPHAEALCIVDDLDKARLDATGLHTSASDRIDVALARLKATEEARRKAGEQRAADAARQQAKIEAQRATAAAQQEARRARFAAEEQRRRDSISNSLMSAAAARPAETDRWQEHARQSPTRDWPTDLSALRTLLGDPALAQQLEQPLATDVHCDQPAAVWHLMAALEYRKRNYAAHPLAIRAVLTGNGCSVLLTKEAIESVLAIVDRSRQPPPT